VGNRPVAVPIGTGGPSDAPVAIAAGAALPLSRRFTPEEWEAAIASRTALRTTGAVAEAALAAAAAAIVDEGKGVRERMAGGVLGTSTRPTFNRGTESTFLYEHSP
jgi:hypothetical protein